jgi:hypothetical protein
MTSALDHGGRGPARPAVWVATSSAGRGSGAPVGGSGAPVEVGDGFGERGEDLVELAREAGGDRGEGLAVGGRLEEGADGSERGGASTS